MLSTRLGTYGFFGAGGSDFGCGASFASASRIGCLPVVPLYSARIQDLGPGDYVKVECVACGHAELLASDQLRIKGQALPPHTPVLDLERRLRCRECDARGNAVVSIRWAAV